MAIGEQLRNARVKRNLTVQDVAKATRMKPQVVEAIEQGDFRRFAAPIYGKGFIKLYAECVGLDPRPLVNEYLAQYAPKSALFEADRSILDGDAKRDTAVAPAGPAAVAPYEGEAKIVSSKPGTPSVPSPAPAPAPVRTSEPDLFSHAASQPAPRNTASVPFQPAVEKVRETIGAAADKVSSVIEQQKEHVDTVVGAIKDEEVQMRVREARRWTTASPIRLFSVLLGILVILIFILSVVSRCSRTDRHALRSQDRTPAQVRLAVHPPPPYID